MEERLRSLYPKGIANSTATQDERGEMQHLVRMGACLLASGVYVWKRERPRLVTPLCDKVYTSTPFPACSLPHPPTPSCASTARAGEGSGWIDAEDDGEDDGDDADEGTYNLLSAESIERVIAIYKQDCAAFQAKA